MPSQGIFFTFLDGVEKEREGKISFFFLRKGWEGNDYSTHAKWSRERHMGIFCSNFGQKATEGPN